MRKLIAAINMSVDGFCEHTAMNPAEEIHEHYTTLLRSADAILYGRVTYQLMENHWPTLVKTPTGIKSMDEFAQAIDNIPKIVFSRTLANVQWETARLAKKDIQEEVSVLKQQSGRDILVGSRSLIVALLNLNLIDEFQLCVHPVILGDGLMPLLKDVNDRLELKLLKTKSFNDGAIILYYEPVKK
jgi:dihydrofolate reductase